MLPVCLQPAVEVLEELEGQKAKLYDDLFKRRGDETPAAAAVTATAAAATAAAAAADTAAPGDISFSSRDGTPFCVYPSLQDVALLMGPPQLPPQLFDSTTAAATATAATSGLCLPTRSYTPVSPEGEEPPPEGQGRGARSNCAGCLRSGCTILVTELIGFALQHTTSPRIRACGVSLLQFVSRVATTEVLLESLLPFLIHSLGDPIPVVRVAAIRALAAALLQLNAAVQHEGDCPRRLTEGPLCALCGTACGSEGAAHNAAAAAAAAGTSNTSSSLKRSGRGAAPLLHQQQQQQQWGTGGWRSHAGEGAPQADAAALFCGYILPALHRVSTADQDAAVRVAVAENLPLMLLAVKACLHSQSLLGFHRQQQQQHQQQQKQQQQQQEQQQPATTRTPRRQSSPPAAAHTREKNDSRSCLAAAEEKALPPLYSVGTGAVLLQPGPADGSEASPVSAAPTDAADSSSSTSNSSSSSSSSFRASGAAVAADEAQAFSAAEGTARSDGGAQEEASGAAIPSPVSLSSAAAAAEADALSDRAEQQLGDAIGKLHAAVLPTLQQLLTCRPLEQRLALLRPVPLLAAVLGPQQTHSFLLPYLIVQLNDPCAAVRAAVIRSLGGLGGLALPSTAESCIIPCCEQCLLDQQEEVVVAAAAALVQLAADGLLSPSSKATYVLLRRKVVPLLLFPSLLLRGVLLHLLAVIEKSWGPVQTYALLMPLLRPVLRRRCGPLLLTAHVAAALRPPLSRQVLLYVMQQQQQQQQHNKQGSSSSELLLSLLFSPTALAALAGAHKRREGLAIAARKRQQEGQQQQQRTDASSSAGSESETDSSSNSSESDRSTRSSDEGEEVLNEEKKKSWEEQQAGGTAASEERSSRSLGAWQTVLQEAERRAAAVSVAAAVSRTESSGQQQTDARWSAELQQQQLLQVLQQPGAPAAAPTPTPAVELWRFLLRIGASDRHALLLLLPTLHAQRQAATANAAAANATGEGLPAPGECPLGAAVGTLGLSEGTVGVARLPASSSAGGEGQWRPPCCRVDFKPSKPGRETFYGVLCYHSQN